MVDNTTTILQDIFKKILEEQLEEAESQEEVDELVRKFGKLDMDKIVNDILETIANDTTRYMRDTMHEKVMLSRANEQEFLARQEQKWCRAFVASESMYIMILEAAESYVKFTSKLTHEELRKKHCTFTAMLHLHGRSLQQFLEIITLMKNGFADGAYARWRSMYELSIISSFITKYGEGVAEAFINSSETSDRYEWARASGVFPNRKNYISFNDIQKNCDIDNNVWKEQYDLANKIVHASSQGTFKRLSNTGGMDIIPTGRSDYGITTPAEHSAISLAQITTLFFAIHPNEDSAIAIKYISNWIDVIREEYFKTHDSIFPDDEKLWDNSMVSYENMILEGTDK